MGYTKWFSLFLVVMLAASSLLIIQFANAQTIPEPSIPEFTLRYVDNSYYIPPYYVIDPLTGQNISIREGYFVSNPVIVAKIKNQPFTPYSCTIDNSTSKVYLYYNFRSKGHAVSEWSYYPINPQTGLSTNRYSAMFYKFADFPNFTASSTQYSEIPINYFAKSPPAGTQVDFQVQAEIGYIQSLGDGYYSFTGESSDWSSTQTLTIPFSSSSVTSAPSSTDSAPNNGPAPRPNSNFDLAITLALVVVAIMIVVVSLLFFRRHHKTTNPTK